jgi:hypothetical protein
MLLNETKALNPKPYALNKPSTLGPGGECGPETKLHILGTTGYNTGMPPV